MLLDECLIYLIINTSPGNFSDPILTTHIYLVAFCQEREGNGCILAPPN